MELVYLWVEEYKNITNQGFRFSPRFECEFFPEYEDEKLKDDCKLIIKKNKDYVSIFPDNINITAIVGENGSGKSGVLETILQIIEEKLEKKYILVFEDINGNQKYLTNVDYLQTNLLVGDLQKYQNIYVYNRYEHSHYAFRRYNIFEVDKVSIVNLLATHYGNPTTKFELSSFMYLPNKIEITLTSKEELIERHIYMVSRDRDEIKKIFLSIIEPYHQYLFICYLHEKGINIEKDILNNKLVLKKKVSNKMEESEFMQYFLQLINTQTFNITDLTKEQIEIYLNNSGYSHFFDFDMIDEKNRRFNDLSHGEQVIFGQLLNIYAFSHNKKDFIFLLDEPEIALHPNWQKKYINEVYNLIKKFDKNYNFILTSHSPFILSDLQKENVIFLEKYDEKDKKELEKKYPKLNLDGLENGNCINVSKHIELKSFGANIHTLLSNGFFMSDGLMGEFAKSKITEIKDFYEKVKKSKNPKKTHLKKYNDKKKDFENIQKIIGEPFLQTIIKNYLDELEILFNGKNQFLDNEIKRLQSLKDD